MTTAPTVARSIGTAELLRALVSRTEEYDFTVWFWGDAIAIDGLLDAAEALDEPSTLAFCERFVRTWADRSLTWVDHLTPGSAVLRVAERTGDVALKGAADRLAEWLTVRVPRSDGAPLYRPDIPMYRHAVWVDTIYHVPPFYARLAHTTGNRAYFDRAIEEWSSHTKLLSDPGAGPFLGHSWDTGAQMLHGYGWGRGVGWALYGMVETLELLPTDHPDRAWALAEMTTMADAVRAYQDTTGFWHTLLHDKESYLESSTAAFFGAAYYKALRLGLLDGSYRPTADLAWEATRSRIDPNGDFWGVSACTYAGVANVDDVIMYRTLPTEVNVWGQGSALRITVERLLLEQSTDAATGVEA